MNEGDVERRLSAILAADVAGYTRLMEQDSDCTVAAWQSARSDIIDPTIANHSGRIVKHTGDGFLAEFPTVQAAVEYAVTMQVGLAASPLDFRMGINLGDIIDDGEDIHGEGVNIAARIEGLADPGGICISGGVYDQVRNRLDHRFEDVVDKSGGIHSPFAKAFLHALDENDAVMDGTQLFSKLRRPVMLNADQTPRYADVRNADHDGGDFLFVRKQN